MLRALFEKTGNAVYISHLDLMRLFQRAFKRAGLHLTHTQGYNPRPSVSIALPLSVGVESRCELLDFTLEGEPVSCEEIMVRLNQALVEGVRVLCVYDSDAKVKDIALLDCSVYLEYDRGIPENAPNALSAFFAQSSILVEKRGKNGPTEQNIIPLIRKLQVQCEDENTLCIHARICCQNPALNPMQISAAIETNLPELKPDFARYCRNEIYRADESIFR
jgi:radical SAM-linked protein